MKFLNRVAVAALVAAPLLAPQSARADVLAYEATKEMFAAYGEAFAYMEACRPDVDRSAFRRAKVMKDFGGAFRERHQKMFSLSYDLGRSKGMMATCSREADKAIAARTRTAMDDFLDAMKAAAARGAQAE